MKTIGKSKIIVFIYNKRSSDTSLNSPPFFIEPFFIEKSYANDVIA